MKLKRPKEERTKLKKAELEEKEGALKVKKNSGKKLLKKLMWLEDENFNQTGRILNYANITLPADLWYPLAPE